MTIREISIRVVPLVLVAASTALADDPKPRATVGAYYFDGWAGKSRRADDPAQPWAKDAPTHLTKRLLGEFAGRKPVWGWRDDSAEIVRRQIDLAADHGIDFFAFCWYWNADKAKVDADPKHTGMELFLKAPNRDRMRFCLLVANHAGYIIGKAENWKKAAAMWMPYLKHERHIRVGGKPLVILFNSRDADPAGLAILQQAAKDAGLPGLAIAGCGAGDVKAGFTHRTHYNIVPGYTSGSKQQPYASLVDVHRKAWKGSPDQPYMPIVTAGWDKRPWEGPDGLGQKEGSYFPDRTPQAFGEFLRSAIDWMDRNPTQTTAERLVLIYAWNEFGEGGYIAPTADDPDAKYLQAMKTVLSGK